MNSLPVRKYRYIYKLIPNVAYVFQRITDPWNPSRGLLFKGFQKLICETRPVNKKHIGHPGVPSQYIKQENKDIQSWQE